MDIDYVPRVLNIDINVDLTVLYMTYIIYNYGVQACLVEIMLTKNTLLHTEHQDLMKY